MTNPITERVSRALPERSLQQVKALEDKRAAAAAAQLQQARAMQDDKAKADRLADKGRHVDRYA